MCLSRPDTLNSKPNTLNPKPKTRQEEVDSLDRRAEQRQREMERRGERRGEEGREGRLPAVSERMKAGRSAVAKGSPLGARAGGARVEGLVDSSPVSKLKRESPSKGVSVTKQRSNLTGKVNLSPTKGRGGHRGHEPELGKVGNPKHQNPQIPNPKSWIFHI